VKLVIKMLLLLIATQYWGCRKECPKPCQDPTNPDCENYDPCFGKVAANADFTMEVKLGERKFEADTFGSTNTVIFTAKKWAESYHWIIGGNEYKTQSFTNRDFPQYVNIQVTLIVKNTTILSCNPYGKTNDTITKTFYATGNGFRDTPYQKNYITPLWHGSYEGYFKDNPTVKRKIELLEYIKPDGANWQQRFILRGFPYPNTSSEQGAWTASSFFPQYSETALYLNTVLYGGGPGFPSIPAMQGYIWLTRYNHDEINMEYKFQDTLDKSKWYLHEFKGIRIK